LQRVRDIQQKLKELTFQVITPLTFRLSRLTINREHAVCVMLANLRALGRFDPRKTVGAKEEVFGYEKPA